MNSKVSWVTRIALRLSNRLGELSFRSSLGSQKRKSGATEVGASEVDGAGDILGELDDTARLPVLELDSATPPTTSFSALSVGWRYAVPVLIFSMLFVGSIRYFWYRVDSVETLQREETDALREATIALREETIALRDELESKQFMIDELQEIARQQARSQRAIAAGAIVSDGVAPAPAPVTETDTTQDGAPPGQRPPRAPLPESLEPGEVLVIVASTPIKEEALELAGNLELDGHPSEVVLGLTGYYGVALGRFEREQAESVKTSMVDSAPETLAPYLMPDAAIESYVYP